MNTLLTSQQRNAILFSMTQLIAEEKAGILNANKIDVEKYDGNGLNDNFIADAINNKSDFTKIITK